MKTMLDESPVVYEAGMELLAHRRDAMGHEAYQAAADELEDVFMAWHDERIGDREACSRMRALMEKVQQNPLPGAGFWEPGL